MHEVAPPFNRLLARELQASQSYCGFDSLHGPYIPAIRADLSS